jgi:hypothetical protein
MSALWISAVAMVFAELGKGCGTLELLQHAAGSDSVLGKATSTINERLTSCSKLTTLGLLVVLVCFICEFTPRRIEVVAPILKLMTLLNSCILLDNGLFFFTVIHVVRTDWGEEGGWNVAKLEDEDDSEDEDSD